MIVSIPHIEDKLIETLEPVSPNIYLAILYENNIPGTPNTYYVKTTNSLVNVKLCVYRKRPKRKILYKGINKNENQ